MPDPLDMHTLLPLWEHPLGEVQSLGKDGVSKALQLTVLRPSIASGDLALNQCIDTNALLSEMQPPAIPPLREARRLGDGRLVLAYDLLGGTTLGQHLLDGPMAVERVIGILRQLCRALEVAHGIGIRHGALSLSSVLLVEHEGRADTVRLYDFGLEDELTVEAMGDHEVEIQPLSPEKVAGKLPDQREDVYLLGAVAHAALTGRPVFRGDAAAVRAAHQSRSPDALDCDATIAAVILRCLHKDPAKRFPDMGSVDDALVGAQEIAGITTPFDDLRPMPGAGTSGSVRKRTSTSSGLGLGLGLGGLGRIPAAPLGGLGGVKPGAGIKSTPIPKPTPVPKVEVPKVEVPKVEAPKVEVPKVAAAPKLDAPPKVTAKAAAEPKRSPSASSTFDATELIEDLRPMGDSESSQPPPPPPAKRKGEPSGRHVAVPPPPSLSSSSAIPAPPATGKGTGSQSSGSGFDRAATLGLSLGRSTGDRKRTPSGKFAVPPMPAKAGDSKPSPAAKTEEPAAKVEAREPTSSGAVTEPKPAADAQPAAATPPVDEVDEADTAEQPKPELPAKADAATKATDAKTEPTAAVAAEASADATAEPEAADDADTAEQAKPTVAVAAAVAADDADTAERAKPKVEAKARTPQPKTAGEADDDAETAVRAKLEPIVLDDANGKPGASGGQPQTLPRWIVAAGVVLLVGLPTAWFLSRDGETPRDAAPTKPVVAAAPEAKTEPPTPPVAPEPTPSPPPAVVADPSAAEGANAAVGDGADAAAADEADAAAADGADAAAADEADEPSVPPSTPPKSNGGGSAPAVQTPKDKARELIRAGDKAYGSGQIAKAESRYKAALEEYPRAHAAAAGLGKIAFNKASYAAAATYYGRAVKAASSNSQYRILYGDALFKLGKFADAKTQYSKAKSLGNKQADGRLKKVQGKLGG